MDYINYIFTDFLELSGDRLYADDKSVIGGIAFLENTPVTVIGQMRGKNIQEQIRYNFFNDKSRRIQKITEVNASGRKNLNAQLYALLIL